MFQRLQKSFIKKYRLFKTTLLNGKKILVFSDSHGGVFEYIHDNYLLEPHYINARVRGGTTAYGLYKKDSKALVDYIKELEKFRKFDTIIIQLGEVDSGFIWWKKAEENGDLAQNYISISIQGYEKLIKILLEKGKRVIITGAILPTIKDNQKNSPEVALRDSVKNTQKERTELILLFNKELKKIAKKYNLDYIDITKETLNKKIGVLDDKYINHQRADHHQNFKTTAQFWVEKLKKVL